MCVTRRLLTSIPTLPSEPARTRAALKIVIIFVAVYGSTIQTDEMGYSLAAGLLEC